MLIFNGWNRKLKVSKLQFDWPIKAENCWQTSCGKLLLVFVQIKVTKIIALIRKQDAYGTNNFTINFINDAYAQKKYVPQNNTSVQLCWLNVAFVAHIHNNKHSELDSFMINNVDSPACVSKLTTKSCRNVHIKMSKTKLFIALRLVCDN